MTVRIINGSTKYKGVPYFARTSQDVIENIDEKEGQRLIDMGVAERISDLPKSGLPIFTESSERIRAKITELEGKLAEAQDEREKLLDTDLQDVAGVVKKVDVVDSHISSLKALISRQQAKLRQAERAEELEAEKAVVKKLALATKEHRKEAEKILNGLSDAVTSILENLAALPSLRVSVNKSFAEAGARFIDNPFLACITLPSWEDEEWRLKIMQETVKKSLSYMDAAETQTPDAVQQMYNTKRYKSEHELQEELRREQERRARVPDVSKTRTYNDRPRNEDLLSFEYTGMNVGK